MVSLIREADVGTLVDITDAITAVEAAFIEHALGTGVNEPRQRVRQANGTLHLMGGALNRRGYWGFKAYTTTREGARFLVLLYGAERGELLAILEADLLGQLRTGAASGVATRYLARPDSQVLGVFGAGYQAETQVLAIAQVFDLAEIRIFSRTDPARERFADQLAGRLEMDVRPVSSPQAALEGADIVTTITNSPTPVFHGDDLPPGVHINAAGSNSALRAELDRVTIQKVDRIFTDDPLQARIECGDLIQAYERNQVNWSQVRPVAEVVAGLAAGRTRPEEITLFESHGIAIWDIALAAEVYEKAIARGLGETLDLLNS